jgi:hypothetical protein
LDFSSYVRAHSLPAASADDASVFGFLSGMRARLFVLGLEALCLSTQTVISLSVKTLLKHVGLKLFLLNSARLLRVKSWRVRECFWEFGGSGDGKSVGCGICLVRWLPIELGMSLADVLVYCGHTVRDVGCPLGWDSE